MIDSWKYFGNASSLMAAQKINIYLCLLNWDSFCLKYDKMSFLLAYNSIKLQVL